MTVPEGTSVDLAVRAAYKVAHRLLRAYWFVRRPETRGALAAVWHAGEILLVKNSYRRQYTLPGGYVRPDETPAQAASRELREEIGVDILPDRFNPAYSGVHPFENRRDYLDIVAATLDERPALRIDQREVVWAGFVDPSAALDMDIVPHLREYLQARRAGA